MSDEHNPPKTVLEKISFPKHFFSARGPFRFSEKFTILIAMLICSCQLQAQFRATQPTISSSSHSYSSATIRLDYTIGELAAVSTLVSPDFIFTQGLHQPDKFSVGINDWNKTLYNQFVYPNPFVDQLKLELESGEHMQLQFQIIDETGRLIRQFGKQTVIAGKNQFAFDLGELAAGAYFLRIYSTDGLFWSTIPLVKQFN